MALDEVRRSDPLRLSLSGYGVKKRLLLFRYIGQDLTEICMPLEQVIDFFHIGRTNASFAFLEETDYKRYIYFRNDDFQFHHIRTIAEWPCRGREHFLHHVPLAPCKYEIGVHLFLNMCAQQGFNILLGIFCYLLKLVNGHYTMFVRVLQILKNLVQCIFRLRGRSVSYISFPSRYVNSRILDVGRISMKKV